MVDLIGQRLGQYDITALLGEGGMAAVYRARRLNLKGDVAIKVIKSGLMGTDKLGEFGKRFEREAETIATLSHPHILKLFDYGQQGDLVYLVMELLTGGSLAELIRQGLLPLEQVGGLLDQIASALDYAHRQGIIHRDLKPQNVLLDSDGNAILTDFGIAKILNETTALTASGMAMGTPAYMSPEQWQGRVLDARSDIYALGVMLFELLSGRLPFSGDTPASIMYMHLQEPPPPITTLRRDLPLSVEKVVNKALAKDPMQRCQSAGDLAAAFKTALTGQTPPGVETASVIKDEGDATAPHPTLLATERMLPAVRRGGRSGLQIIGAVVVVVLIGVLAVILSSGEQNANPTATQTIPTQAAAAVTAAPTALPTLTDTKTAAPTIKATATESMVPTLAPVLIQETLDAVVEATDTAIAVASFTRTPTPVPTAIPSETPNIATLAAATFRARETATANAIASFTRTPTLTPIATPTPTETPNMQQTLAAVVGATDTAVAGTTGTLQVALSVTSVTANAQWRSVEQILDGVAMVLVPPGCFMMGSDSGSSNEKPVTKICFDKPFWIDKTEVTNGQFARFGGQAGRSSYWTGDNRPREQITWFEARDFCARRGVRLPTEAEWEYAARGPDGLIYPWGKAFVAANVVYNQNSGFQTAEAGSKPGDASWVGALDLGGNVEEWVSSLYNPYPYDAADGRENDSDARSRRVRRGGSYLDGSDGVRTVLRNGSTPDNYWGYLGFRCARSYSKGEVSIASTPAVTTVPTVTANAQWKPVEQTFDGVAMMLVPPGCFMMGDNGEGGRQCFDKPFWVDKYEVTNGQFAQFGGQARQSGQWTGDNRPREQIAWFEARDFCAKRGARLPTEAEWEYAARGPDGLVYPWGNALVEGNLVWLDDPGRQTAEVGSKPGGASWVGALDLSGNVSEWMSSLYQPYPYDAADGREDNSDINRMNVVRGGSWSNAFGLCVADRSGGNPTLRASDGGFRCARSYSEEEVSIAPTLGPSAKRTDEHGVAQVYVPAGCFMMGRTRPRIC